MAGWKPLLGGEAAEQARALVDEMSAVVASSDPTGFDLSYGAAGWGVLLAYRASALGDEAAGDRAIELLDASAEAVAAMPSTPGLHGGFIGVAWAIEHVLGGDGDAHEDPNAAIDRALGQQLTPGEWNGHFDLMSGLVGLAVYLFERRRTETVDRCLDAIADLLRARAEAADPGLRWPTPRERAGEFLRDQAPLGNYNVGVSHGVAGIIAVLARIVARGRGGDRARSTLDGAVSWLLSLERESRPCRLPGWIAIGGGPAPARLGWCYGDLGVAAALMVAARALRDDELEVAARRLASAAAKIPIEHSGIQGASLCHGALGNAHMFNRLFQATGDAQYRLAALRWFERGMTLRPPSIGVSRYADDTALVDGMTGGALALLAAITPVEPRWDRVFLTDVPMATD